MKKFALAVAGLLVAAVVQAKPLYITVSRSFSTAEQPVADVAFEQRGPVQLRVLKPTHLDAFLEKQANLRRAYSPVEAKLNPGRYVAQGLNKVDHPVDFLRGALGIEFRQGLKPALPGAPSTGKAAVSRLNEGPERLVGIPADMELVSREWLNLDLGGADRTFTVPGFETWGGSGFQERRVTLSRLPAGLYVLQLVQGRIEGQVVLVVTDLRVQVKQTDGEVLVRVAGADQLPRAGVEVALRTGGARGATGKTDDKGEVRLATKEPKLLITARAGTDLAVVDTDFYSTLAASPDVFIYSDRPIYRPGDEIQFRGLVRRPDSFLSRLFTRAGKAVEVKLALGGGGELSTTCTVDGFGSFSGKLAVPDDAAAGVVRLVASVADGQHQSEARVQNYVKPTFYVEVLSDQETIKPGSTVKAKIRVRRYDGGPIKDVRYEYFLYRSLLDSPAWVDDAGMGGKGSAVTYGTGSTTEGKLSVPDRLFSSVATRKEQPAEKKKKKKDGQEGQEGQAGEDGQESQSGSSAEQDTWASAPQLDAQGEATVEVPVPALAAGEEKLPYRYTLSVRARDDQETFANAGRSFYLAPSEVTGVLRPSTGVVKAGAQAVLSVKATTLSGKPYAEATGTVAFVLRKADGDEKAISETTFKTGSDGIWRGPMPAPSAGTVLARVTLRDRQNQPWSGETSLLAVGEAGEESVRVPALTVASLSDAAAPGDLAELVALFPGSWGSGGKNGGKIWLTLSGTGLFETRVTEVSGLSFVYRFPVEQRFGSAVFASVAYPTAAGRWEERTVGVRIIPPERVLKVSIAPQRPEAQPLGPQTLDLRVTDSQGKGVAAQVSIGVVDKAVYAVQGEFRPRVLDFFYPLVRDNVSTFTSAEFQGYGYGERLARMLRRPGYAFAAVKPPTKVRETDTAYWNPAIVTDRDGHATVTFQLPSNQTLWTVTAVAADASGRFGEGTTEFAARGKMNVYASLPQFLREGDEATGSVRVARNEGKDLVKLSLRTASSGALEAKESAEELSLAGKSEKLVPVQLEASQLGAGQVVLALTGGPTPMADRREVPVRPASVEETVYASAWGGGKLELAVPAGAAVDEVELSLRPSTVAVALANIEDLLVYPHGCLEQLVATTIPNVAVYQTLEKAGALERLDTAGRALLSEARSRAVQGIERILSLEVKGGGFTWFSGYDSASVPLTLVALDGLSYAVEAGLTDRDEARILESVRWISEKQDLPLALDATRTYVLARLQGAAQAAQVRAFIQRATASQSLHAAALAALAADRAGVANEPEVKTQLAALVARASDGFVQPAVFKMDAEQDDFFQYPLRRAGFTAILGHAASLGGKVDIAVARRRLLEALGDGSDLSTFERSTALLHSLWLIEKDAREMRAMPAPKVEVSTGSATLAPHGAGLSARLDPATRSVNVAAFEGQAVLRAKVRSPLAAVHAKAAGMSVKRTYYRLTSSGKKALAAGEALHQGEEIFVELALDAHDGDRRSSLRSAYYVLEDPVPAGFTVLGEDKAYRGAPYNLALAHEALKRRSLNPERADFYFEEPAFWSQSPRVVGYVMRAQFAGKFSAPPATVADMYAPKIRGQSEPAILTVAASRAK